MAVVNKTLKWHICVLTSHVAALGPRTQMSWAACDIWCPICDQESFCQWNSKLPKNCSQVQLSHLQSKVLSGGFCMVTNVLRRPEVLPRVQEPHGASSGWLETIFPEGCVRNPGSNFPLNIILHKLSPWRKSKTLCANF